MKKLSVRTTKKSELVDITSVIKKTIQDMNVTEGICVIYCPHTTAGITINESYDDAVKGDFVFSLNKISPDYADFKHMEGNSDAHVKSSLIGCSEQLIIKNSNILLGQWQGIYFAEFDGPRRREVWVKAIKG